MFSLVFYGAGYYPKIGGDLYGGTPIFVMIDFTVEGGPVDVNTLAYTGDIDSITNIPSDINLDGEAHYMFDTHHKGISPSLPTVNTSVNFSISDTSHPDGTPLTVKTVNNYNPNGFETSEWATHVNPQENPVCRDVGVQSDLLPLLYYDPNPNPNPNPTLKSGKPSFYGSGAEDNQITKETWIFDVNRTQIRSPNVIRTTKLEEVEGDIPPLFRPNDLLSSTILPEGMSASDVAVPLGNYGVIVNYTITINNSGSTRYLTYKLGCNSNVVISKFDGYKLKTKTPYSKWYNLGTINPGQTVINFSICMPTADAGEFYNQFIISDTPAAD